MRFFYKPQIRLAKQLYFELYFFVIYINTYFQAPIQHYEKCLTNVYILDSEGVCAALQPLVLNSCFPGLDVYFMFPINLTLLVFK